MRCGSFWYISLLMGTWSSPGMVKTNRLECAVFNRDSTCWCEEDLDFGPEDGGIKFDVQADKGCCRFAPRFVFGDQDVRLGVTTSGRHTTQNNCYTFFFVTPAYLYSWFWYFSLVARASIDLASNYFGSWPIPRGSILQAPTVVVNIAYIVDSS